jgi:hypothetical protein
MPELEQRLRDLAGALSFPETPDVAAAVEARLSREGRGPARRPRRRALVLAVALLVAALGAVLALPAVYGELDLGELVPLAEAQAALPFRIALPAEEEVGRVEQVFLDRRFGSGAVSIAWPGAEAPLVLTEFRGETLPYVQKLAGPTTEVVPVSVDGAPGVWLEGGPHVVLFRDPSGAVLERRSRLSGNVLLWERGGVTYRLEGEVPLERALEIAGGVRAGTA